MKKTILFLIAFIVGSSVYAQNSTAFLKRHLKVQCIRNEISYDRMNRLIKKESNWNPEAIGKLNANGTRDYGLVQINEQYTFYFSYKYLNGEKLDPFNGRQSIDFAIAYLLHLYEQTGSWESAFGSYNMGLTGYRERSDCAKVQRYIRFIIDGEA